MTLQQSDNQGRKLTLRKALVTSLQFASLIALLALVISRVDPAAVISAMSQFSVFAIGAAVVLHVLIIIVLSMRFLALFPRDRATSLSVASVYRMTFAATLANLLLPTALLGDAGRVWLMRKRGVETRFAVRIGVSDRLAGLVALALAAAIGAVFAPMLVPDGLVQVALLLLAVLSVALWFFLPPSQTTSKVGIFVGSLIGLSLLGHGATTVIAYMLLQSAGETASIIALLAMIPVMLLAAAVPVSIGGWGSRELAAMVSLPMIGIDQNIAVAMSIMYGLTQVAAAVLGFAFLTLFSKRAS
jgi:uncharacterized membrane protein YbhN (UPF0104 family)